MAVSYNTQVFLESNHSEYFIVYKTLVSMATFTSQLTMSHKG